MSTVNERQSSPGIKNRDSGPAKSEGKQPLSVMRFRKDRLSWTLGGRVDVSNGEGGKHVRRELRHTEGRSIKRLHWALPSVLLGGEYSLQHFTQTTETKTKDTHKPSRQPQLRHNEDHSPSPYPLPLRPRSIRVPAQVPSGRRLHRGSQAAMCSASWVSLFPPDVHSSTHNMEGGELLSCRSLANAASSVRVRALQGPRAPLRETSVSTIRGTTVIL